MCEISKLLQQASDGDPKIADQLLPIVYDELRKLAAQRLRHEAPGQTLQATALVHDAYLRLISGDHRDQTWESRGHFFAAAALAMRRILVERSRRKGRIKRGGELQRRELADPVDLTSSDDNILALDESLARLEQEDAIAAQIVNLHHFAGLRHQDVAEILGMSVYEVRQKWTYARAWLRDAIENG